MCADGTSSERRANKHFLARTRSAAPTTTTQHIWSLPSGSTLPPEFTRVVGRRQLGAEGRALRTAGSGRAPSVREGRIAGLACVAPGTCGAASIQPNHRTAQKASRIRTGRRTHPGERVSLCSAKKCVDAERKKFEDYWPLRKREQSPIVLPSRVHALRSAPTLRVRERESEHWPVGYWWQSARRSRANTEGKSALNAAIRIVASRDGN